MQRPNNNLTKRRGTLYDLPPAQSTRSSTSDIITTPEFTGSTASLTVSSGLQRTLVLHPPTALTAELSTLERLRTPPNFDMAEGGVDKGRGARTKTTTSAIYPSDEEVSIRTTNTSGTTAGGLAVATAGAPTATTTVFVTGVGDATFAPPSFRGNESEDANDWLSRFGKYASYRGMIDHDRLRLVAVFLRDAAGEWWDNLDDVTKNDWGLFQTAFKARFEDAEMLKWKKNVGSVEPRSGAERGCERVCQRREKTGPCTWSRWRTGTIRSTTRTSTSDTGRCDQVATNHRRGCDSSGMGRRGRAVSHRSNYYVFCVYRCRQNDRAVSRVQNRRQR